MNLKKYYVVESLPDGLGVPYFLDKHWSPELPIFDIFSSSPNESLFEDFYNVRILADCINGDYFPDDSLISDEMLLLLVKYGVNFFSRKVEVRLSKKNNPKKKYNLFFLKDYVYLLDQEKSVFVLAENSSSGYNASEVGDGPQDIFYDKIEGFIVKKDVVNDFFFCKEITKPVCSEEVKDEFNTLNMKGVQFIPLDDKYKFDPWGDF